MKQKYKIVKRLIIVIFIFLIVAGETGCMAKGSYKDKMMRYMNEKYDDDFSFISVYGGYLGSNTKSILVSSQKFPDQNIYVYCVLDNELMHYYDNYLGIKYKDQMTDLIHERLTKSFSDRFCFQCFVDNHSGLETPDGNMSFEAYAANPLNAFSVEALVVYPSSLSRQAELSDKVLSCFSGVSITGRIYFIDEDPDLSGEDGALRMKEIIQAQKYQNRLFFSKKSDDVFISKEWKYNQ